MKVFLFYVFKNEQCVAVYNIKMNKEEIWRCLVVTRLLFFYFFFFLLEVSVNVVEPSEYSSHIIIMINNNSNNNVSLCLCLCQAAAAGLRLVFLL